MTIQERNRIITQIFTEDIVHECDAKAAKGAFKSALESEDTIELKLNLETSKGTTVTVRAYVSARRKAGRVMGCFILARRCAVIDLFEVCHGLNIAAFCTDRKGVVDEVSQYACSLMQNTSQNLLGKRLSEDLVVGTDGSEVSNALQNVIQGNPPLPSINMSLKSKGAVPTSTTIFPRIVGGTITGSIVLCKKPEEGILRLLDSMGIAAWYTDLDGRIDECNRSGCAMLESLEAEILDKELSEEYLIQDDVIKTYSAIKDATKGKSSENLELTLLSKNQKEVCVKASFATRVSGNSISGSIVMARRNADNYMLGLFDKLGIAAWLTDMSGMVNECNTVACKILDYQKREVISTSARA